MQPDIKMFSKNRQIFPREQKSEANRLICGHLNKLKFQPNIDTYLQNRIKKISQSTALARASRCLCHQVEEHKTSVRAKIEMMYELIDERKQLASRLQNISISTREVESRDMHKIDNSDGIEVYTRSVKRLCGVDNHKKGE